MTTSSPVRSGSARLAHDDHGDGPPVVLLHPGVGDRRCWDAVVPALAARYRVVTYDRRGAGETRYEAEPHDPRADLAALLDALGLDRVALVGNSRGGRVALDFTLAYPDRVAALVLVAPAVGGAPPPELTPAEEEVARRYEEVEAAGDLDELDRVEAHVWLDGPFRPEGTVGDPARALFLETNRRTLAAPDPGPEAECPPAWDRLGELALPVQCVVGAHDFPYQVARSRELAARVPGARLVELAGSAHLPQLDDPATFASVVGGFLAECYPAPSRGTGQT